MDSGVNRTFVTAPAYLGERGTLGERDDLPQAIIALATSSASTARFNGDAAAAAAIISLGATRHEAGMDHPRRDDDNADLGSEHPSQRHAQAP